MAVSARIAVRVRSAFGLALGVLIGSVLIPIAALVVVLSRLYGRNFGQRFLLSSDRTVAPSEPVYSPKDETNRRHAWPGPA